MCQMCDEYEYELRRHGLIAEAEKVRAERHGGTAPEAKREPAPARDKAVTEGSR